MSTGQPPRQPTEEELLAAYEAEIKKLRVEHVLLENVVTVINLGMRRTGLMPGSESERDPDQVRLAVESVRALLPLLETATPEQVEPLRQALSQLQMAYVRLTEGGGPGDPMTGGPAAPGAPGTPESQTAPSDPTAPAGQTPPGGGQPPPDQGPESGDQAGEAGPAQRSGRLWIPGQ